MIRRRDVHRRSRCVRQVHGPVLVAARAVVRGLRRVDAPVTRSSTSAAAPARSPPSSSARVGAANVAAADPSEPFVEAARERFPDVDVRLAPAEQLPFADGEFDAALAQLVVHFMSDPLAGVREMARVTKPGGVVAACVWDRRRRPGADLAGLGAPLGSSGSRVEERGGRRRERAASPSCSAKPGSPTSRSSEVSVAGRARRRSTSGGSRSRSASGRSACSSKGSAPTRSLLCARTFSARSATRRRAISAVDWAARGRV